MKLDAVDASYSLWLSYLKFRRPLDLSLDTLSGRDFHTLSRLYGKSVRYGSQTSGFKPSLFDINLKLASGKLKRFDLRSITPVLCTPAIYSKKSPVQLVYDAGFFFPSHQPTKLGRSDQTRVKGV